MKRKIHAMRFQLDRFGIDPLSPDLDRYSEEDLWPLHLRMENEGRARILHFWNDVLSASQRQSIHGGVLDPDADSAMSVAGMADGTKDANLKRFLYGHALSMPAGPVTQHLSYARAIKAEWPKKWPSWDDWADYVLALSRCQIALAPTVAKHMKLQFPTSPLPRHIGFQTAIKILTARGSVDEVTRLTLEATDMGWRLS